MPSSASPSPATFSILPLPRSYNKYQSPITLDDSDSDDTRITGARPASAPLIRLSKQLRDPKTMSQKDSPVAKLTRMANPLQLLHQAGKNMIPSSSSQRLQIEKTLNSPKSSSSSFITISDGEEDSWGKKAPSRSSSIRSSSLTSNSGFIELKGLKIPTSYKPDKKIKTYSALPFSTASHLASPTKSLSDQLQAIIIEEDDPELAIHKIYPIVQHDENRATIFVDLTDEDEAETGVAVEDPDRFKNTLLMPDITTPDDWVETDAQFEEVMKRLSLVEPHGGPREVRAVPKVPSRIEIESCSIGKFTLTAGKSVELKDGSFLRVEVLFVTETEEVILSGKHFVRENFQGLVMPKRRNELVWMVQITSEQADRGDCPYQKNVSVDQVQRLRQITLTNQRYPNISLQDQPENYPNASIAVSEGPLFCRWKRTKITANARLKLEESITGLSSDEADTKSRCKGNPRIDPGSLRFKWRGRETTPGGSFMDIQEVQDTDGKRTSEKIQKYTFGDAFCGAGGTSRGALDAGLKIKWAFDHDADALKSYKANFSKEGAECLEVSVHEFLQSPEMWRRVVDVLHISPPCQPFSPAHTVPSWERDEANQAALFSVYNLLEAVKPRIATIEETEGLLNRHYQWFSALINIFVSLGYSVRWKVLRCDEYGVPQARKRLCIIAAGPGEKLPPFMRPTHGPPGSGLKRLATIYDCIRNVPTGCSHHDTNVPFQDGQPRIRFDPHILAKTVTCNGGIGNYHPSGLRHYTVREMACLQTFPLLHSFADCLRTKARRQVGNAVPPVLAKALFRFILKSLQETDCGAK